MRLFQGIQWAAPTDLHVSQLYLNHSRLKTVEKWFDPNNMNLCQPLPVHDFGNGKLTLVDGHSRAFAAYRHNVMVPIVYDTDTILTSELGQKLYKNDLLWCQRFHIQTVADLSNRIVDSSTFQTLWIDRCNRAFNLLTKVNAYEKIKIEQQHADLFLYGANDDLTIYYFENVQGQLFEFSL